MNTLFAAAALAASTALSPLAAHAYGMREFRPQPVYVQPAVQPVYAPIAVRPYGYDRDFREGYRGGYRFEHPRHMEYGRGRWEHARRW